MKLSEDIDLLKIAKSLSEEFGKTAVERDKAGGTAKEQLELVCESGLLKLLIPTKYGGYGKKWSDILQVVREFAKRDGSIAHIFGYHNLFLAATRFEGTDQQYEELMLRTVNENLFWGNANNTLDTRLIGELIDGHYVLNGKKGFSSGSTYADLLFISFRDKHNMDRVYRAVISPTKEGVHINDDWDCIGQRQTASGSIHFTNVKVEFEEVLNKSSKQDHVFYSLGATIAQSILSNIFIGSAEGAIEEAVKYTKEQAKPWYTSGVEKAVSDPIIIRQYGEFGAELEAAISLVDKAGVSLDKAYKRDIHLTAKERGDTAYIVAAANVVAGKTALHVTSKIFEVMGARSTHSKFGYDRFWRNVRVHTLHNPQEYKVLTIGNYILNDEIPKIGIYS